MKLGWPLVRRGLVLFSSLCVLALLSACGSSSRAAISASTAGTLHRDVQQIRLAAAGHHAHAAHADVNMLRRDITRLTARGELARADARVLMVEADQVDGRVSIEVKAVSTTATAQPSPTTPPRTTPVPPPAAPSDGKGRGKDKGAKGKKPGHGHGGD
jgi:hypothetical protein